MTITEALATIRGIFFQKRAHPSDSSGMERLLDSWSMPGPGWTGITVNEQNALTLTAFSACVRVLAESTASLPLILYKRRADRGKDRATGRRLYRVLHDLPNSEMTAYELRELMVAHVATWGNAYAEIVPGNGGQRVFELWPLRPDKVEIKRIKGKLFYVVTMPKGKPQALPFERVWHIKGLSGDGIRGYSLVRMHREAIGLAMATEKYGGKFFGNGARPGSVLTHPGELSEKAEKNLRASMEIAHKGLDNAHRLMILEEGMDWKHIGLPPEDSQFLQTREFQLREICRIFRMPPHKIADLKDATFSNIEEQSLEFVTDTLRPWLVRIEQSIYRDLLSEQERRLYFAEHLVDALLRGDIKSRYEAYNIGRQGGWLNANEIRERENMNPRDDEGGDVYLDMLNLGQVGDQDPAPDPDEGDQGQRSLTYEQRSAGRVRLAGAFQGLLLDAIRRVIRREANDVRGALKKQLEKRDAATFLDWLERFYQEHKAFWIRAIVPILESYADQVGVNVADELDEEPGSVEDVADFIAAYTQALANRQTNSSFRQLRALLEQALLEGLEDPAEPLRERLEAWEENDHRATGLARDESSGMGNALALAFYGLAGIERIVWRNTGNENCPYCRAMDGRVVGINDFFLPKNTDFMPEGADRPLKRRHNIGHPPLHNGCDCVILAER